MAFFALIASLPVLKMEEGCFMTLEKFLYSCTGVLSKKELADVEKLEPGADPDEFARNTLARRYSEWEGSLRNELVRLRANRLGADPSPYLNGKAGYDPEAASAAAAAFAAASPLERERVLDTARWTKIEELERGGYFTFDRVCGYRLKLAIQRKWLARDPSKTAENLDSAASGIASAGRNEKLQEN